MILIRTQFLNQPTENNQVVSKIEEPPLEPREGLISFLNTECRHCECSLILPHFSVASSQSVQLRSEE